MMTTKLVVTHAGRMRKKYGRKWGRVSEALDRLVAADARRGIATTLVALDKLGTHRAVSGNRRSFKAAFDHAYLSANRPDYVLILGGPDVVPHQSLTNPLHVPGGDDEDPDVPSDLPYACDRPASSRIADFVGPTRVVGRLPDLPDAKDPAALITLLDIATKAKPRPTAGKTFFSVSCVEWKKSTAMSLRKLFGSGSAPKLSPKDGPRWTRGDLSARWHFINCHGAPTDHQFYGQRAEDFPIAHHSPRLPRLVADGTVVAAECCYGAEVFGPLNGYEPIGTTYLREGAFGYVGSTNIAYGPADDNDCADLVCRYFLEAVRDGASLGRALLEARQKYVKGAIPLDPIALKTVAQFLLLGDPSVHVVVSSRPSAKNTPTARAVSSTRSHAETRGVLVSTGELLARGADAAVATGHRTSPAVAARMKAVARNAGLVPTSRARTYEVTSARDPRAREAVAAKRGKAAPAGAGQPKFHVMFADWAATPAPKGAARGRRAAKAGKARSRTSTPEGVKRFAVVLAAEQGTKITIKRLYARLAPSRTAMADRYEGRVIKKPFAAGSKSARPAVILDTGEGELVLRRAGGNAFRDAELERLVGHRIKGTGHRTGYTLILQDWECLDSDADE